MNRLHVIFADNGGLARVPLIVPEGQGGEPWVPETVQAAFQNRVAPWMDACFGPEISADKLERNDRFIEEALELVQASGYPKERALALVDYVYGREQGEINQEVGGVMVTLAAHCLAHGVDMHDAGETELARIWTKVDVIRAKQAAKPKGSALPIATGGHRMTAPDLMPSPRLDPNCQCVCHRAPGYIHAVACCSAQQSIDPAALVADETVQAMIGAVVEEAKAIIADFPTPRSEDVMHGHEDAYRALEVFHPDAAAALERALQAERLKALEEAASLPCAIIPYSPENKAALDAITAYRDAIRALKEAP
jgi:hypothetical protein